MLAILGAAAILTSLLVVARPTLAGEVVVNTGNIGIFKQMCDNIGKQDVCNGRDTSLEGYSIDYTVQPVVGGVAGASVQTITVVLGDNSGGGGNVGGGSQGRKVGTALPVGTYLVCEAPHPNPFAYKQGEDNVPLDALPRPEPGNGGSSGGPQVEQDNCILVTITTGTSELKFLDQRRPAPETGTILILKTDDGDPAAPLADAEFSVEDSEGAPVGDGTYTSGADGTFCVQNLTIGDTYTVTETVAPVGHTVDATPQDVTVEESGTCDSREGGPDATFVNPEIVIEPPTPTLVVDKAADAELIEILDDVATPSVVTWTLTYTLTNGPVHNAMIEDEVPDGFIFLDAANGGTEVGGVVTWTFAELSASGSVSFRTTVDVDTISRTGATVNTATIISDETPEDDGQDSVTVTDEDTLGGNPTPTPAPTVPNTAMGASVDQVPASLLSLLLLAGLGTMLYLRLSRQR
jgi:hypothetical protein